MAKLILAFTLAAFTLVGCELILDSDVGQKAFDYADKMVEKICELPESDRKLVRAEIKARYGVDTSPVCDHVTSPSH